jgi:hypothetical protein
MPAPHPRRILPRSRRWPGLNRPSQEHEAIAIYGVTAVRYREDEIEQLMLGLIDPDTNTWALKPSPARLIEVVDRLLGGDQVRIVKHAPDGRLHSGAALRVKMLDSGAETLETVDNTPPGHALQDLPRF